LKDRAAIGGHRKRALRRRAGRGLLVGEIVEPPAALIAVSKVMSSVKGTREGVRTRRPRSQNGTFGCITMVMIGLLQILADR
jgi:hypothetical protein